MSNDNIECHCWMPMSNVNVECQCRMPMSNANVECQCRMSMSNANVECQWWMSMLNTNVECQCWMPMLNANCWMPIVECQCQCRMPMLNAMLTVAPRWFSTQSAVLYHVDFNMACGAPHHVGFNMLREPEVDTLIVRSRVCSPKPRLSSPLEEVV